MKKKFLVLLVIVVAIGLFAYSNASAEATNQEIDMEWVLSNNEIEELNLLGAVQDVEVIVTRTDAQETVVSLQGKVSSKTEKYLENTEAIDNLLKITLSDIDGLMILPSSSDKDVLILNVQLGKEADINKLNVQSIIGNVNVQVLESYQGQYNTDVSSGGEVLEVPDTDNSQNAAVYVKTIGDITITK